MHLKPAQESAKKKQKLVRVGFEAANCCPVSFG